MIASRKCIIRHVADEVICDAEDEYEMSSRESSPQISPDEAVCFMLSHESN